MMRLYVAFPMLQSLAPAFERDAPRDEAGQPVPVGGHERPNSALVMVAVGVHRTEHDIVIEHRRAVDRADVDVDLATGRRDAQQANDAARRGAAEQRRRLPPRRRCTPSPRRAGTVPVRHRGRNAALPPSASISCGLRPLQWRSNTCTSSLRSAPINAASSPIGPAPVTSRLRGRQDFDRQPIRST